MPDPRETEIAATDSGALSALCDFKNNAAVRIWLRGTLLQLCGTLMPALALRSSQTPGISCGIPRDLGVARGLSGS